MNVIKDYEIEDLKDDFIDCEKIIVRLEDEFEGEDISDVGVLDLVNIDIRGNF